jgi:hypothetical protein
MSMRLLQRVLYISGYCLLFNGAAYTKASTEFHMRDAHKQPTYAGL